MPDVATPDAVDWDALNSVQQAYMVEVVGRYPDDPDEWYRVDAGWLREALDGRDIISPRSHLLPLLPPEPEAVTRSTAAV